MEILVTLSKYAIFYKFHHTPTYRWIHIHTIYQLEILENSALISRISTLCAHELIDKQ